MSLDSFELGFLPRADRDMPIAGQQKGGGDANAPTAAGCLQDRSVVVRALYAAGVG
jgi:hypothetical protein